MHIIRAGVDSLYLSIRGTLPAEPLGQLARAKAEAGDERRDVTVELGHSGIKAMVGAGGQPGGYAFVFDTGPLGCRFACRAASDRIDWNLFVKPHASALLALGFQPTVQMVRDVLADMGVQIAEISLNRIDYAIDVRCDDFVLDIDRFVAHPKAKRQPRWSEVDQHQPAAIMAGRRLESVTIGRMPGKQVIVYDKTAEARAKRALHWLEAWNIAACETNARVWRVELRLGRDALKKNRRMRHLEDLDVGLRPALTDLSQQVRYTAAGESDPNVSRRRLDPLWILAGQHIAQANLLGVQGQLPAGRVLEITQAMKIDRHEKMIVGNAASLAATMGLDDEDIADQLPGIVAEKIQAGVSTTRFRQSIDRARRRHEVLFGNN